MTPKDPKYRFIHNEILTSAINAAFQRGKVYPSKETLSLILTDKKTEKEYEKNCKQFKKYLKNEIDWENIACSKNIEDSIIVLCKKITEKFKNINILNNNEFRAGTAQKLINLYLKYRWCLGWSPEPPHCPFDEQVIGYLRDNTDDNVKQKIKNIKWTQMGSKINGGVEQGMKDYQNLVESAKIVSENEGYQSIAEWELQLWNEKSSVPTGLITK